MVANALRFDDEKALQAWLQDQPAEWAQVVAVRGALRVFPLVLSVAQIPDKEFSRDLKQGLIVSAWRALFISWASCNYPPKDMDAFFSSPSAFSAARAAAAAGVSSASSRAAAAARAASSAADASISSASAAPAVSAVFSAALAADAGDPNVVWDAVSADARFLQAEGSPEDAGLRLLAMPLWIDPIAESEKHQTNAPAFTRQAYDDFANLDWVRNHRWELITDWYKAILPDDRDAEPRSLLGENADVEIATQPDEFWNREPEIVLEAVAEIVARARASAGAPPIAGTEPASLSSEADAVEDTDHIERVDTENHRDTESEFLSDHPDAMVDYLDRSAIAFQLAGRINQIWDTQNPVKEIKHGPAGYLSALWTGRWKKRWDATLDTGFVVHLDAPWGGGKTNFASYVTRILNPWRDAEMPQWLADLDLPGDSDWMGRYRRPWLVVNFNAWNHQHVDPPWWVFAETIRQQCMRALWTETNQREAGSFPDPLPAYDYRVGPIPFLGKLGLWLKERVWRMQLGSALVPLFVAALTFAIVYAMFKIGFVSINEGGNLVFGKGLPAFALASLASLFGGVATIRSALDYVAKNLFSGTPAAAQQFELGSADPLERFRYHFARTIEDFGRPIVVVVDDLDRCSPKYVVDLVRGMQAVMVSPRIVYLLLGDRDWIEKAFAETHKAMAAIDVGPEHSFGGRFVEKAIQMSFVLPEMDPKRREKFTEAILKKTTEELGRPKDGVAEAVLSDLMARQALDIGTQDIGQVLGTGNFRVREQAAETLIKQVRSSDLAPEAKTAFETDFSARLARKAATDQSVVKETGHMLVGLAPMLPGNPRQIKRIINTITVMQQVARLRVEDFRPLADDVKWQKLARWAVVMIEWPQTWFTLTKHAGIMDWVLPHSGRSPKSEEDMKLAAYAALVRNNEPAKKLLLMPDPAVGWEGEPITTEDIRWLANIMPATSGSMLELPSKKKEEQRD